MANILLWSSYATLPSFGASMHTPAHSFALRRWALCAPLLCSVDTALSHSASSGTRRKYSISPKGVSKSSYVKQVDGSRKLSQDVSGYSVVGQAGDEVYVVAMQTVRA